MLRVSVMDKINHKISHCIRHLYITLQLKHSSDSFLVLITDGVTFSMNNQEVVNLILAESTPQLAADQVGP